MTVTIIAPGPTDLYARYRSQDRPQPAYVELDIRDGGTLTAGYDPEIGGAHPETLELGVALQWDIPSLTGAVATALLHELAGLAQQIVDDATVEARWPSIDILGHYGPHAKAARAQIERLLEDREWESSDLVGELDGGEVVTAEIAEGEYGLAADTTDSRLAEIAEALQAEADTWSEYGHTVITDLDDVLEQLRDNLRQKVTRGHHA